MLEIEFHLLFVELSINYVNNLTNILWVSEIGLDSRQDMVMSNIVAKKNYNFLFDYWIRFKFFQEILET